MGTRNLTIVISNGKTKVAQYGQWDGYPSGQGKTILKFLKGCDMAIFKTKVDSMVSFIKDKDIEKLYKEAGHTGGEWVNMEVSNRFKTANPQLNRDMAAEVLQFIYDSENAVKLQDSSDFIKDSLFCEWAYIIDLDKNTLEIRNGAEKTYPLTALPDESVFIAELEGVEESD